MEVVRGATLVAWPALAFCLRKNIVGGLLVTDLFAFCVYLCQPIDILDIHKLACFLMRFKGFRSYNVIILCVAYPTQCYLHCCSKPGSFHVPVPCAHYPFVHACGIPSRTPLNWLQMGIFDKQDMPSIAINTKFDSPQTSCAL